MSDKPYFIYGYQRDWESKNKNYIKITSQIFSEKKMGYLTRIGAICDKHYREESAGIVLSSSCVMWPPHLILVSYFRAERAATVSSQLKK